LIQRGKGCGGSQLRYLRYLTHPQVRIDASVPVPRWGLSDFGRERVETFKATSILQQTTLIVSSGETKALETAAILANHLSVPIAVREDAHENDRSATGFLPPPEFERVANDFFANPELSVRGWERAIDAQQRIVKVFNDTINSHTTGDIIFVGHGGVGTLLFCHLANLPIQRIHDQPQGGGNVFSYDLTEKRIDHSWLSMEQVTDQVDRP
jgi:broad specificity phosphatase PhoE